MNTKTAGYLILYGGFLMVMGLAGYLSNPEKAKTALMSGGTFNDWRPDAAPMLAVGDGRWVKKLALSPGTYEYCFVVDGVWKPDPQATVTFPNPFGGLNTVLIVAAPAAPMSSLQRPQEAELTV